MKRRERDRAVKLRERGYSLNEIVHELKVSKASVSVWVRDIKLSKSQSERLSNNGVRLEVIERRRETRISNTRLRHRNVIDAAKEQIGELSKSDLRLIGTMLYWGEGGKTKRGLARVANSDPSVIRVMMRYFREILEVPEKKFRGHVHTYSHLNSTHSERYWSRISGIPTRQFYKTYSKPSVASKDKKDSTPNGTFDIYVCDTVIFLTIMGWIEKISELATPKEGVISKNYD